MAKAEKNYYEETSHRYEEGW